MKHLGLILLVLFLLLASGGAVILACTANATNLDCHAEVTCTPPAGGQGYCSEGPNYASCYSEDKYGDFFDSDFEECQAGGGGGSGGGGGGCDPTSLDWWIYCDPFAM